MQDISLEQARFWLACEARRLGRIAESGEWPQETSHELRTPEEISLWAEVTAEAIRVILRAAGLSDDWHLNQDAEGADPANTDG